VGAGVAGRRSQNTSKIKIVICLYVRGAIILVPETKELEGDMVSVPDVVVMDPGKLMGAASTQLPTARIKARLACLLLDVGSMIGDG
jgi:hypothetical protein